MIAETGLEVFRDPVCLVLMPAAADLTPLLTQRRDTNGLGPNGFVYEDLRILEATRRLMEGGTVWRIPLMNRELVERSTHPDALEEIENELGNDWIEHGGDMAGARIAGDLTAQSAVVRRDRSFLTDNEDVLFGSVEERIRTRLGDEGIRVEFEPPPAQPHFLRRQQSPRWRFRHTWGGVSAKRRAHRAGPDRRWICISGRRARVPL